MADGGVEADREPSRLEDRLLLAKGEPLGERDQAAEAVEQVVDRLRVETVVHPSAGCDDSLGPVPLLTVLAEPLFDFVEGERAVLDSIGEAGDPALRVFEVP